MKSALPLVLDLSGRLVVAVGGGPVSARRVRALVDELEALDTVAPLTAALTPGGLSS